MLLLSLSLLLEKICHCYGFHAQIWALATSPDEAEAPTSLWVKRRVHESEKRTTFIVILFFI